METLSLSADDHPDVEDEESTPISPQTPDNAMNVSVGPASEPSNFISVNPEVRMNSVCRCLGISLSFGRLKIAVLWELHRIIW
jgi:hypothetical protein